MTQMGRFFAAAIVACTMIQGVAAAQIGRDLAQLTVPAAELPAACRLAPATGGPFPTNPAIVTDPQLLGFMHSLVFGPTAGDQPGDPAGVERTPPTAAGAARLAESMTARGEHIVAGYAAAYRETGGSHEIGVFALRLKDRPETAPAVTVPRSTIVMKGAVVIFTWSDATASNPDRGCVDVVRRHIDRVQLQ